MPVPARPHRCPGCTADAAPIACRPASPVKEAHARGGGSVPAVEEAHARRDDDPILAKETVHSDGGGSIRPYRGESTRSDRGPI